MKKTRKILLMAACAVLLVCISVGATVAYLTSTDSVTNTFTVGNIQIKLDEAATNTAGEPLKLIKDEQGNVTESEVVENVADATRVKANVYKLMPGHEYTKDPTIRVAEGSENCYLFVKVDNQITAIEKAGTTTIAKQMENNGWVALTGANNATNVYYLTTKTENGTVVAKLDNANTNPVVFEKFVLADDADTTNANANYATKKVTVTAYAVQADGFDDAKAAWDATFGAPSNP